MNQGNPYESVIIATLRDLHHWLERQKKMQYNWETVKNLHDERISQLLDPTAKRVSFSRQHNPLRILSAVRGLFRWQASVPKPHYDYDTDCQPETAC